MASACQLYQLVSKTERRRGEYVAVNGPWDSHGVILSSKREPDGRWLNQIRGVPPRKGEKPTCQF